MAESCHVCDFGYFIEGTKSSIDDAKRTESLKLISKLGYSTVAVDYYIENILENEKKTKKKDKKTVEIKDPCFVKIKETNELNMYFKIVGKKVKQYTRLTTKLHDPAVRRRIHCDETSKFDLLAVVPTDEKMLLLACQMSEIDIISLDLKEKLGFFPKRKYLKMAIDRGIYFEIPYGQMITDPSCRSQFIANSVDLVQECKGRNIILTSRCGKISGLRSAQDVKNVCSVFGMTEKQAKDALTINCTAVLKHAEARKSLIKGVITIKKIGNMDQSDQPKETENISDNIDDISSTMAKASVKVENGKSKESIENDKCTLKNLVKKSSLKTDKPVHSLDEKKDSDPDKSDINGNGNPPSKRMKLAT